jgi:hypothetical protein
VIGRKSRAWSDLLALGWAVAGVLGGHVLTYALLYPDHGVHDLVLAQSGHSWTTMLGPAVLVTVVVATGLAFLRRDATPARGVRLAFLATVQLGLFLMLEMGERIGAGMTLHTFGRHLVDHGLAQILVVGALIQLVTAWFGSALSRLVAVAAREPGSPQRPRSFARSGALVPVVACPRARAPLRAHGSRAPPGAS